VSRWRIIFWSLSTTAVFSAPPASKVSAPKTEFPLNKFIVTEGPGVAVLVSRAGNILYTGAAGFADVESRTPLIKDALFNIGIVSQQMTALATLMLIDERKISAADSIRKYIPELPPYTSRISIHHLLYHESGLPDYEQICDDREAPLGNAAIVVFLKTTKSSLFAPGKRFRFTNTNYALLAEIVSRVAAIPFADFIEQKIFRPFGMQSAFVLTPTTRVKFDASPTLGYGANEATAPVEFSACDTIVGDGSVIASIFDLDRWFAALWQGQLVTREVREKIFSVNNALGSAQYALGFERYDDDGVVQYYQEGAWGGFTAAVTFFPEQSAWVIVMANSADFDSTILRELLYKAFLTN